MSATRNEDTTKAVSNQPGQFGSRIPPSEPLTTHGHKPGVIASERDAAPEFHAETLPPGTAPKSSTYQPNPTSEVPPVTNYAKSDDVDPDSTFTRASDTMGGDTAQTTSASVHTGLGHPGSGQTSVEERHDGAHGRKKQRHGLEGVGASGRVPGMVGKGDFINHHDPAFANQRALNRDDAQIGEGASLTGTRGNLGGPAAEERIPEGPERVAAEAPRDRSKIH